MQNLTSTQYAELRRLGPLPFPLAALQPYFPVKQVWRIASELEQLGLLIRLKRNLFVLTEAITGCRLDPLALANRMCTPSYVSREAALSHYGLIPELVVNVTNSRLGRTVAFDSPVGYFHYAQVDRSVYALGLREETAGTCRFLCASPEKALYDLVLWRTNLNVRSVKEMRRFLLEDLRLNTTGWQFDSGILDELIAGGRKKRSIAFMKEVLCHGAV